jgi:2-oxoglutarate ferredoxin oxidoreductase subunit alpha
MDYTIKVGGEAGQGVQTIGDALARVCLRSGYHVFSHQDYESRVRGGHNFYQIRISEQPLSASRGRIDILVALDRESIVRHKHELAESGIIMYDSSSLKQKYDTPSFFDIPFVDLAVKNGGMPIMANTVATGAVLGILGMELARFFESIAETFREKGDAVVTANRSAARAGHEFAAKNCTGCSFSPKDVDAKPRMLMNGVESIALGALASGCRFYAAYPMTPSTGIMNYLAAKEQAYGIVVEQAEDEIAAINMALGASFAGARAMTGTSGGGFALMVEGLSLAGMTETPIVIALGQRPGPATGLPTRTEQGDLQFALSAGHGEFPRVVFAPGTPREAFFLTNKAFDLAEKYQIPALILFDTYLADALWTFDGLDIGKSRSTNYRLRGESFGKQAEYRRHALTENGISPLGVPGDAGHVVVTDSDEHDESGHIIEDAATREKMVKKRLLTKLPHLKREIAAPYFYGAPNPQAVIVGWGSTFGVLKECIDVLAKSASIAMLHFRELFPFPLTEKFDFIQYLQNADTTICIEHNATGQFARLMRAETGHEFSAHIHRFDGRPFTVEGLAGEIDGYLGKR